MIGEEGVSKVMQALQTAVGKSLKFKVELYEITVSRVSQRDILMSMLIAEFLAILKR